MHDRRDESPIEYRSVAFWARIGKTIKWRRRPQRKARRISCLRWWNGAIRSSHEINKGISPVYLPLIITLSSFISMKVCGVSFFFHSWSSFSVLIFFFQTMLWVNTFVFPSLVWMALSTKMNLPGPQFWLSLYACWSQHFLYCYLLWFLGCRRSS